MSVLYEGDIPEGRIDYNVEIRNDGIFAAMALNCWFPATTSLSTLLNGVFSSTHSNYCPLLLQCIAGVKELKSILILNIDSVMYKKAQFLKKMLLMITFFALNFKFIWYEKVLQIRHWPCWKTSLLGKSKTKNTKLSKN